ncbi:MAG: DUF6807 family protein [Ginsengibacter sp.]
MKKLSLLFIFISAMYSHLSGQNLQARKTQEGIEITENGKKILLYQVRPKSLNGMYERAGYVHPLYDLNENIITEDMPPDHPYHRGIFWAWHQIILNGKHIADGWISDSIKWEAPVVTSMTNSNKIAIHAEMIWNVHIDTNGIKPIIKELTNITIHKKNRGYRIIEFDINLLPLVDSLQIGGSDDAKGYGGFCLRLKLPADLTFISEGKKIIPQDTAVNAGPWMDFKGSFAGAGQAKSGVAVFGYTKAIDKTHKWILRDSSNTSMQNVPFPGRTPISISHSGLHLSYRVIVHDETVSSEKIEELYHNFINETNRER